MLVIEGGGALEGRVSVAGFKHAFVLLVARLIGQGGAAAFVNVPRIKETEVYQQLLPRLGVQGLTVNGSMMRWQGVKQHTGAVSLPAITDQIHGSLYLLPALVSMGQPVIFGSFGGCPIGGGNAGERPWRHVVDVMCRFGAAFKVGGDKAPTVWAPDGFSNAEVDLQDYVIDKVDNAGPEYSGASKAATLCASLGAGESVLRNPYTKCESQVLLENLRKNKVNVTQLDATSIALTPGHHTSEAELPCTVVLPPDVLEIATWVTAVGIVGGCVVLDGVPLNYIRQHLTAECMLWETVGIDLREQGVQSVVVQAPTEGLLPRLPDIVVSPRGIYSDCQPMFRRPVDALRR